jgi:hypothetical protein
MYFLKLFLIPGNAKNTYLKEQSRIPLGFPESCTTALSFCSEMSLEFERLEYRVFQILFPGDSHYIAGINGAAAFLEGCSIT